MKPTAYALRYPHQSDETIFLENINITHINNHVLPKSFEACVRLHFHPRMSCRIESDDMPKDLINLEGEVFRITTADGFEAEVLLGGYSLNDLIGLGVLKGFLILRGSSCLVVDPNKKIKCVNFGIINFPEFQGPTYEQFEEKERIRFLGSVKFIFNGFRIEIVESPSLWENRKLLNRNDGYVVSHTGLIERCDGKFYSAKEAEDLLRKLRVFLSFARGAACGLALVKANLPTGRDAMLEWGTQYTDPWLRRGETWFLETEGGEWLSRLLPKFLELSRDPDWKNIIFAVIDWYLHSNTNPSHVGIILAQAALESLSYKIADRGIKPFKNQPFKNQIENALEYSHISKSIPKSCENLSDWIKSMPKIILKEGPDAIIKIRNDLVHSDKRHGDIPVEALIDAHRLSQWYIEMMLLCKLGYHGRYRSRVSESGIGTGEIVPWAAKECQSNN